MTHIDLIQAAKTGNTEAIELLSQANNFDPNIKDKDGYTPLMWAAHKGHLNVINMLLEKNADVTIQDDDGSSLMHFAVESGNPAVVMAFANRGLSFHTANKVGRTPLHFAAGTNTHNDVIALLLSQGADINAKNHMGYTPLHVAVSKNNLSTISILVKQGAAIDEKNNFGEAPIITAFQSNYTEMVEELTRLGSNINIKTYASYRLCSNILNMPILSQLDRMTANFSSGGKPSEARSTIKGFLVYFISEKNLDKKHFQHILNGLDYIDDKNLINNSQTSNFFIAESGFRSHSIYFSLKKEPAGYKFSFAERGIFSKRCDDRIQPFFNIKVPEEHVKLILESLLKAERSERDDAYRIIFEEIPNIVGQDYEYLPTRKKSFKQGHCFFENLKSIVNYELIETFGHLEGEKLYQEFTLFMEMNALSILKKYDFPNKEFVIQSIENLIDKKILKLDDDQAKFIHSLK